MDSFFKSNIKWKPYPKNKFSGIDHLGFIPSHWDVDKLKNLASARGRLGFRGYTVNDLVSEGEGALTIGGKHIKNNMLNLTDPEYISWEKYYESPEIMVEKDDLLFAQRGSLGKAAIVENNIGPSTINPSLILLKNINLHSKYLYYYLISNYIYDTICMITSATAVPMVSQEQVKNLSILVPSMKEQGNISAFLNCKITKIDAFIAKKERLIEVLQEKRAALISHAVTKGFDPNVPMKDSGVEWIGEIPVHWQVLKFSREVHIAKGQIDPEVDTYSSMLLIAPNHIESCTGQLLLKQTAEEQGAQSGKYMCRAGEVIYSKIRPALAKVTIAPSDCICSADMYPLNGDHRFINPYLFWLFLSNQFKAWSILEADRVAMPKINRETLNQLKMPNPPLPEQHAIADYLGNDTSMINKMITKVETTIERLQEYRTALISAAVTGKIDVRNEVGGVV